MKFEDLKLPDWSGPYQVVAIHTARAVYDQMREHYEADDAKKQSSPVEYVPLDPEDVPPGSAVRYTGKMEWYEVLESGTHSVWAKDQGGFSWPYLAKHCEILRPGSKTWEPCKKIKS